MTLQVLLRKQYMVERTKKMDKIQLIMITNQQLVWLETHSSMVETRILKSSFYLGEGQQQQCKLILFD